MHGMRGRDKTEVHAQQCSVQSLVEEMGGACVPQASKHG